MVRQNLIFVMGYILLMLALLATGYINPIIAAVGHGLSGLVVIFNSARLFREGEELADDEGEDEERRAQPAGRVEHVRPVAAVAATA